MAFSKGKVFISHNDLIDLLELPDDIEIVAVENSIGEHLELHIASRMPINGFTVDSPNWKNLRRQKVPSEPMIFAKMQNGDMCECGVNMGVVRVGEDIVCAICEKPRS